MLRLWTQENAPFWRQHGLQPADAGALEKLMRDAPQRVELATRGREAVHARFDPQTMAVATAAVFADHVTIPSSLPLVEARS